LLVVGWLSLALARCGKDKSCYHYANHSTGWEWLLLPKIV
jgi:hypothetical protein